VSNPYPPAPYLSVIVPFRNADEDLQSCLAHLAASSFTNFECVLVGDGSEEHRTEMLHKSPLPVRVFRNSTVRGPAVARNVGARVAAGEILVFLDADVGVRPETLALIAARFRQDPNLDAVFGSYDDSPAVLTVTSQFRNLLHAYTHRSNPQRAQTFWAGCGAVKRALFLEHDGFSERYARPSIEDIELGARMAAGGAVIEIDREIQVQHRKEWTLASMCWTDVVCRGIPWTRLLLERREMPNQLSLRYHQRLSVLLTWACLGPVVAPGSHVILPILLAMLLAMVFWLNRDFYGFLARRRGWTFTAQSFALHLLYFLNCGLGLCLGVAAHCVERLADPAKKWVEMRRPA